ncbi:MAG: TetR/AcrR family transcriptional regulator C-terminal domain-containing protein [Huintestinicola sp.]
MSRNFNDDRRVVKTKRVLRLALAKLMREKSVREITVRELAAEANINRGTFYIHYKDIFDLTEKIEQEMLDEYSEIMKAYPPEKIGGRRYELIRDIFRFIADNSDMCTVLIGAHGDMAFINKLRELVKDICFRDWADSSGNQDRITAKDLEYQYAFVVSGCVGLIGKWLENGMAESPEKMAERAEKLIRSNVEVLRDIR